MTKRGDDAVLTTYDNNRKNSEKHSHTSYLRAATMPRNVYWLPVLTVLATGGRLTNNWFVGEGIALEAISGEPSEVTRAGRAQGTGKYYGRRSRKA